jgi:hypothetical protein
VGRTKFSVRVSRRAAVEVETSVPQQLQDALRHPAVGPVRLEVVDDAPRASREKFSYEISGFVCGARYITFRNSLVNAYTTILERVFYHEINSVFTAPGKPDARSVGAALKPFLKLLKYHLPKATPMERHAYVAATYRGRKLAVYQRALEKLDRRGLLKSDSFSSAFLKWEKILEKAKRQVARLVQPRAPAYNVELGRYLHPIEHDIYLSIDHTFQAPTVMKGLNSLQQGQIFHNAWTSFQDPVACSIDALRFDQHIGEQLLEQEHSVYKMIYPRDPYLAMLLRWQLETTALLGLTGYSLSIRWMEGGVQAT